MEAMSAVGWEDFLMVETSILKCRNDVSAGQANMGWRGEEGVHHQKKQQGQRSEVWGFGLLGN